MKKIITYIALACFGLSLNAQTERQLTVSEIRQQTELNEPLTLQKGFFKMKAGFNYLVFSTEYYNNNWQKEPSYGYLSNSFNVPFAFSYGLTNSLEVGLSTNYEKGTSSSSYKTIDYYNWKNSHTVNSTKSGKGFNDLTLSATYSFLNNKTNQLSMALAGYVTIPYGKNEPTASDDSKTIYEATSLGCYEVGFGYLLKKIFYPFSVTGIIKYAYSFPTDLKLNYNDEINSHIENGSSFNSSVAFNYMPCDWIGLRNEISFTHSDYPVYNHIKDDRKMVCFQWNPSLTFQIKNIRLTQGISFPIIGKNTMTNPIINIALSVKI